MKINDFWGDLTDNSAKKEALDSMGAKIGITTKLAKGNIATLSDHLEAYFLVGKSL